mmetsp:Transcript_57812/g.172583  ORF Transcript_57812/g.172583 Transcript_57812/m.172583 type:complete len:765 (-) Transcript_57812:119-2413(-)
MKSLRAALLLLSLSFDPASKLSSAAELTLPSPGCFDTAAVDSGFSPGVWSYCRPVAPGIFLYYTPTNGDGNALVGLRAPSHAHGWSSLALAGNGGMKGASQIVVRRSRKDDADEEEEEEWIAEDRYSADYVAPSLDDSQDVKLLFAAQSEESGTSWGVALLSDSCDDRDYPVVDRSVWMHWALGPSHDFAFHGNDRGQFHANLMRAPPSDAASTVLASRSETGTATATATATTGDNDNDNDGGEEVIDSVNILMPNVNVVTGEGGSDPTNPYICGIFDMEEIKREHEIEHHQHIDDAKVHITGFSQMIDPLSEEYVHHMILYGCDDDAATEGNFQHKMIVPECGSMPRGCQEMKFLWAVGAQGLTLPPDVGIPLGGGQGGGRWLAIQMHYYNPKLDGGIKDNSGVQMRLTPQLRTYDAGYLTLVGGVHPFQREAIPAGETTHVLDPAFVVPSTCTDWDEPLNVLSVTHHEHQVGKKVTIEVERDGKNLGPTRLERVFDFNHHSSEESAIPQLMPGDEIVMTCVYDTSSRTEDVAFGDGSQDEMCFATMLYYPEKPGQDSMIYLPVDENEKALIEYACSNPGMSEGFKEVSMCAEVYMTDITSVLGIDLGKLGASQACDTPSVRAQIERTFPGACPTGCESEDGCTDEETLRYGQEVVCPGQCDGYGGLTLWPDTSVTQSAVKHGAMCGNGVRYFEHTYIEAEECEVRGDLNAAEEVDLSGGGGGGGGDEEEVEEEGDKPASSGAGAASLNVAAVLAAAAVAALF